ncbi:MAG: insulinase family protein [bacterium]|nr:insulinase family protein [bacterium]
MLLDKVQGAKSVSIGFWYFIGSRIERKGEKGYSHLIEHLIFQGTEEKDAKALALAFDKLGTEANAFTERDSTCFYVKVLKKYALSAIDLLAQMLSYPAFREKDVEKEKKIVIEEYKSYMDNPEQRVHDMGLKAIWGDHPLTYSPLGEMEDLLEANPDKLRSFWMENYTSDNLLIAIAGDIDERDVKNIISQYPLIKRKANVIKSFPPPDIDPAPVCEDDDTEVTHIVLVSPGVTYNEPYLYPASALTVILSNSMGARLFQKIREERGLAYSLYSYLLPFRDAGIFASYVGTGSDSNEEVLKIILDEYKILCNETITDDELERAKVHLSSSLILGTEGTFGRMEYLAKSFYSYGRVIPIEEIITKIQEITPKDIQEISCKLFNNDLGIAVLGREGRKVGERLWKVLRSYSRD